MLPDPPPSLPEAPRAFYEELAAALDAIRPAQLDLERTSVEFDKKGLTLNLAHASRDNWSIWISFGTNEAIIGTNYMHEHFFAPEAGQGEERPWTTTAVDFAAELLRGEVEIETTFRGNTPIAVTHFNRDATGHDQQLGRTGFLRPARLLLWRPKRVERERVSFT